MYVYEVVNRNQLESKLNDMKSAGWVLHTAQMDSVLKWHLIFTSDTHQEIYTHIHGAETARTQSATPNESGKPKRGRPRGKVTLNPDESLEFSGGRPDDVTIEYRDGGG